MNLPTPEEMYQQRKGQPLAKGTSRLEKKTAVKKLTVVDDNAFRKLVFERDRGRCRCCERKVSKGLARVPQRAEVRHIHGRRGVLRHEDRAALLLCCGCHEKVTGKVNEKVVIQSTWFFQIGDRPDEYLDARKPVKFVRVA